MTIRTDKFSTYALAYTEKPQEKPAENPEGNPKGNPGDNPEKNPAMGIEVSLIPLTLALAALTVATVKRKKK